MQAAKIVSVRLGLGLSRKYYLLFDFGTEIDAFATEIVGLGTEIVGL